ncbi:MAG: hypothetical protein RRC07_04185 [Anaerolineae bacterium]|nr:hypothetical protein [Anaerolineae bacterium]
MKKLVVVMLVVMMSLLVFATVQASTDQEDACWGQASAVFAATGVMGQHSSDPTDGEDQPRVGLRNLARSLYDQGVIADDSMASLGAFVAAAEGLSIDACDQ